MQDCPSFYGFQAKGIGSDTARNICSKLSVIRPNHSKVFEHRMDTYMDPAYVKVTNSPKKLKLLEHEPNNI